MAKLPLEQAAPQASALRASGQFPQAQEMYRQILRAYPYWGDGYSQLAEVLIATSQFEAAATALQKAINNRTTDPAWCWNNLGVIHAQNGRRAEAADAYRRATLLNPRFVFAHYNLGNALAELQQFDAAEQSYRSALALDPWQVQSHNGLGLTLLMRARYSEAIPHFQRALDIDPADLNSAVNIVLCHGRLGDAEASEKILRQAIARIPTDPVLGSALVLLLNYTHGDQPTLMLETAREFDQRYVQPLAASIQPHANNRDPHRRLRVGYISPDFKTHSVAFFLKPLLAHHDRRQFLIVCYSQVEKPDGRTAEFEKLADLWRNIVGQSDEKAADQIRADGIDILIDLAGHTVDNRMMVLARRPAPVQITWLGYPGTSGVSTIDIRITDATADPPGTDSFYSEKLLRLPDAMLVYQASDDLPPVQPPPALRNGFVTFGSFNDLMKASEQALNLWAKVLLRVPGSRLIMKALGLADPAAQARVRDRMAALGISSDRLEFLSWTSGMREHLELYHRVDIALDTYPYNGTTTTLEALSMGVPVLTLAGPMAVSRMGVSILNAIGLSEFWTAKTADDFVQLARERAEQPLALAELRESLRDQLSKSVLCDGSRFTTAFEVQLKSAFSRWFLA